MRVITLRRNKKGLYGRGEAYVTHGKEKVVAHCIECDGAEDEPHFIAGGGPQAGARRDYRVIVVVSVKPSDRTGSSKRAPGSAGGP